MGNDYRTDRDVDTSSKEATIFNSLPPWFGCFCYLLVGLSVSLVYVLSEVDYLMLSGVFRAQRFFSDDPFYFSKQVLIVYGFVGFLVTILVGPIGRLPCVLWSWALSCAYFCLSFYVFLYSFSQYGRFMMLALALLSLLSHVLLANFVFFLFDGGAYDFRLPRCFAFLIGFFAGSPLVSFVLFRLKLCFTTGSSYEFKLKTFDIFRLFATLFSLAMLSSLCLTYEFFAYGDNNYRIEWAPAKRVRAPVRAIAQFVDGEVVVLLFLLCPMWVDLGQYAAQSHGDWVEARLGHKAMFAVALIALLLWTFASAWQLCVQTINEINAAIFKVMFTDGYLQLKDDNMKDRPVSITSLPNYKPDCKSGKKIKNTLKIPGPVMYPYMPDTWDDAENEDKLMLSTCLRMLNGLDSISHYLEMGSTAELCKLTNELNLQDCWLETQDPLAVIGHVLNEYNNTLSTMLGNCLNLYDPTKFCSGSKFYHLLYIYYFHPYHTNIFPSIFNDEIKSSLDYFKCRYINDIGCLKNYVCTYICQLKCFKTPIQESVKLVCEIDDKLQQLEENFKNIIFELKIFIFGSLKISALKFFATNKPLSTFKKLGVCKQKVSRIKTTFEACKLDDAIDCLNTVYSKLVELECSNSSIEDLVYNIENIIKTLESVEQLMSTFNSLLCKLKSGELKHYVDIFFMLDAIVRLLEPRTLLHSLAPFKIFSKSEECIKILIQLVIVIICRIKGLINNAKTEKHNAYFNFCCIRFYKLKIKRNVDRMKECCQIITTFFNCSINANNSRLKELMRCLGHLQISNTGQKVPDSLSQSLIDLKAHLKELMWLTFAHMTIVETKIVISRLGSAINERENIFDNIRCVTDCSCYSHFKSKYGSDKLCHYIYYFSLFSMSDYRNKMFLYYLILDDRDKDVCLCLIVKYILYPRVTICLCYLFGIELHISGSLCRKYDKYSEARVYITSLSKALLYAIEISVKITNWVRSRYICCCDKTGCCCKRDNNCNRACLVCKSTKLACVCKQSNLECCCNCFCRDPEDHHYMFLVSFIIYMCSLIENITKMDNIEIQEVTQNLSLLMLEFYGSECDSIESNENVSSNYRNVLIFSSLLSAYTYHLFLETSEKVKIAFLSSAFQLMALNATSILFSSFLNSMLSLNVNLGYINLVYQNITSTSFSLINSKIRGFATTTVTNSLAIASSIYFSCLNNPRGVCTCQKNSYVCKCCRTLAKGLTMANGHFRLIISQLLNTGTMELANHQKCSNNSSQISNDIINSCVGWSDELIRLNRNARILDATCSLSNTSHPRLTDLNPKYYVSDKVFRPSACFGFGYFKFVITRFFLVVFLILMFWFLRFRFDPFVPGAFSQLRNYDYAATSAHLASLIAKSQNAANSQSPSDATDTSGVRDAANVGIAKPRLKKAKHFVLIGAFAAVSAVYITLVIRDIYVAVTVDFATLSYLINVAIVCGMFMTLFIKYFIHLYDFVQVLQRYGVKLTRASTFLDTAARGGSHAVMLLSLVKTMGADLSSLALLKKPRTSSSSYSEMKNSLYPYNTMSPPVRRMTTADSDHIKELESLRQTLLASLGDAKKIDYRNNRSVKKSDKSAGNATNTLDLHSVLDFVSYVLMSKTSAFHYHTFSADDSYLSWRLGRPLNQNFFLLAYARYTAVYELYARTQSFNFGQFYTAEQNCNRLWRAFGDTQIDAISLKCMSEDSLSTPMTEFQAQILKAKITEEYLQSFLGFQSYVATTVFGVKENKSAGLPTDSLFPFLDAFNKVELDSELVTRLATKFFGDNQRKVSAGVAVPSSTCALDGDAQRVRERLTQSCTEWLEKKRHCCESLAGAGCDCIVHRAHDMVLRALSEPGDVRDNIVELVGSLNLEDVEVIEKSFGTDVGARRALKDFSTTLLEHRQLDAVSQDYESTVAHYLNAYLVSTYENRDRAAVPLGLYMQWHGAPLCEHHLRNVDKFDHFI